MNIGISTRLGYDYQTYDDNIEQSTAPLSYVLSPYSIANPEACAPFGGTAPRPSVRGYGVSTVYAGSVAPAQQNIDIDSILTNRNVPLSQSRAGELNPINVLDLKLINAKPCNNFLCTMSSLLDEPAYNYRGIAVNRFYDLPKNPQANIFYNFAQDTRLEAIDNYVPVIPNLKLMDGTAIFPHAKPKLGPNKVNPKSNNPVFRDPKIVKRVLS